MKKVEEVSRLSGVSRRTLQYYDDEGILPAKRSDENYRLYDDEAMKRLWEILWYKEMGFHLREIKEILSVPKEERGRYFEQKIKIIGEEIQDLEVQREFITNVQQYEMFQVSAMKKGEKRTYKEYIRHVKEERKVKKNKDEKEKEHEKG